MSSWPGLTLTWSPSISTTWSGPTISALRSSTHPIRTFQTRCNTLSRSTSAPSDTLPPDNRSRSPGNSTSQETRNTMRRCDMSSRHPHSSSRRPSWDPNTSFSRTGYAPPDNTPLARSHTPSGRTYSTRRNIPASRDHSTISSRTAEAPCYSTHPWHRPYPWGSGPRRGSTSQLPDCSNGLLRTPHRCPGSTRRERSCRRRGSSRWYHIGLYSCKQKSGEICGNECRRVGRAVGNARNPGLQVGICRELRSHRGLTFDIPMRLFSPLKMRVALDVGCLGAMSMCLSSPELETSSLIWAAPARRNVFPGSRPWTETM